MWRLWCGQTERAVLAQPFGREFAKTRDAHCIGQAVVHHFWRDRAVRFGTKDGRDQIIAELSEDAEKFEALDKDVRSALKPVREKLGIKERLFLNRKIRFAKKALVACSF